jgi:hypothetical protein
MDESTNEIAIYLNDSRVLIYRKLPYIPEVSPDFVQYESPQPFDLEKSDPQLVLMGGLQHALNFLGKLNVRNARLTIYVPSPEIAEALVNQEFTDPALKDLWKALHGKINAAGHTVDAIAVDQQLADTMTAELAIIEQRPAATANANQEIWKPWPRSPDRYEVSSHGRVRSLCKMGRKAKNGILKPVLDKHGYESFVMVPTKGAKKEFIYAHRMILETFVGMCPEGDWAAHYDDAPSKNHIGNLRWDTPMGNGEDRRFNNPKGYLVERLQPGQQARYWDHDLERVVVMYG